MFVAQNVTEVKVELGQNVTLTCSGEKTGTYWYMQINRELRGRISRTFKDRPNMTDYCVHTLGPKYSAWDNSLVIADIAADDCRLYSCGRMRNDDIQMWTHSVSSLVGVSVRPPNKRSEGKNHNDHQIHLHVEQNKFLTYGSFVLNFLFVTGLFSALLFLKKKQKKKDCSRQVTDPDSHLCAGIQPLPFRAPPPSPSSEPLYYKVQLSALPGP
ncbi:hypothetical protein Q5P01_005907 [Channa striata]|uniref:Immunoglobulin subtype domain-containing protein n=1 Tax=Channa striata TaxID=64152 RepID=A0AA88T7S7_CHASR|nr:hypothetical protein Q5P01_005907 [Channa striata]